MSHDPGTPERDVTDGDAPLAFPPVEETDPVARAEAAERRRAAEDELMRERNTAQRDAGNAEQALILPGEPGATAVTGLGDEAGGDLRGVATPPDVGDDDEQGDAQDRSREDGDDVDRTVRLGGEDD